MFYKIAAKKEIEGNKFLSQNIKNQFIRKRADNCLQWFIHKAVKNKYWYYSLSVLTIVGPVASEIVINMSDWNPYARLISSIILGISTIAAAFLNLFDVRRKWGVYRNEAEDLKRILSMFEAKGDNEKETEEGDEIEAEKENGKEKNERMLLEQMEESMDSTHKKWMEPFNKNT